MPKTNPTSGRSAPRARNPATTTGSSPAGPPPDGWQLHRLCVFLLALSCGYLVSQFVDGWHPVAVACFDRLGATIQDGVYVAYASNVATSRYWSNGTSTGRRLSRPRYAAGGRAPTTPTARRVPAAGPARESTRHVSVPAGASTAPSRRPRRADRFPPTPRIGEVSGVRAEDIDRKTWMWTVRRQTTPGPGGLIDKGTKGKCTRTVPLIEEVRPIVAHRLDPASKPDSRLFTGPRGGRISTAALRDALGRGGGHRTRIRASAPPRPTAHRPHLDG